MEQKEITKEQFFKVLDTFFPHGCSGDREKWQTEWFCGWSAVEINSSYDVVLSINVDSEKWIAFDYLNAKAQEDISEFEVAMFIRGAMKVLCPDMSVAEDLSDDCHPLYFGFKELND